MTTIETEEQGLLDHHVIEKSVVDRIHALLTAVPRNDIRAEQVVEECSILSVSGLGKEIWEGIDPGEYVDGLRDEWPAR